MKTFDWINTIVSQEIDPAFAQRSQFIFNEVKKIRPLKVLDAGCGRGFYVKALTYFDSIKEIVGVDVNNEYLKKAKALCKNDKHVHLLKRSIYSLPFADNYFDCIIFSEVLEHLDSEDRVLHELHRVLKPQGTLIITVPNNQFPFLWDPLNWILMKLFNTHINKNIWWLAGIWADHERLYTERQLIAVLKRNSYRAQRPKYIVRWCWPFTHFLLYGIGKNLVERGGVKTFNRFNFTQDRILSRLLARCMALPSHVGDRWILNKTSVNIAITARKYDTPKK